jgi:hypothetical protein
MLGIGLGIRQRGAFTPRVLFSGTTPGVWYDPSDLSTMFQDSAGAVAAALDAPVGRINDKSGRGNHATQSAAGSRPVLRSDSGGRLYLEFDGADDDLVSSAFAITQPWDRISAVQQISWSVHDRIFTGVGVPDGGLRQGISTSPGLYLFSGAAGPQSGSLAIGTAGVVTERHNGASSRIALNNEGYSIGDAGTALPNGIRLGVGAATAANFRLYGVCMVGRALSEAETARARRFMAARAGVTL